MSALKRPPVLSIVFTFGAIVTVVFSLLALSGVFGPRITVRGSVFFDACNGGPAVDSCVRRSGDASGVAIEYQAVGGLPLFFKTNTDSRGQYRLELPPGRYRAIIRGCKSWPNVSPSPPYVVVSRESMESGYNWTISADGTCQAGGIALTF